jgi:hypothetical protein
LSPLMVTTFRKMHNRSSFSMSISSLIASVCRSTRRHSVLV